MFWIGLIISWFSFLLFVPIQIGLFIWVPILVYLFVKKSKLKWFLICFSSWTIISMISFTLGAISYFQGNPSLKFIGYPSTEFYNLNKEYRVWQESSGCVVTETEVLTHLPNNLAVMLCTKLLGYQKNAYNGYYPDKEEATQLLAQSDQVILEENDSSYEFNFTDAQQRIKVLKSFRLPDNYKLAQVKNVNDELIILSPIIDTIPERKTYLIDMKNGKVFAYYFGVPYSDTSF